MMELEGHPFFDEASRYHMQRASDAEQWEWLMRSASILARKIVRSPQGRRGDIRFIVTVGDYTRTTIPAEILASMLQQAYDTNVPPLVVHSECGVGVTDARLNRHCVEDDITVRDPYGVLVYSVDAQFVDGLDALLECRTTLGIDVRFPLVLDEQIQFAVGFMAPFLGSLPRGVYTGLEWNIPDNHRFPWEASKYV